MHYDCRSRTTRRIAAGKPPATGAVVLTGDLFHYPAERTLKDLLPPARCSDPAKEAASRARIEALLKERHATLWIAHDLIQDATIRKSPDLAHPP